MPPRQRILWPGLLAGMPSPPVVAVPALEFALHSTRSAGRGDQLTWSLSWPQLLSVAWPFAEHPRSRYWEGGDQFFILTLFLGTLTCALALAAPWRSRRALPFGLGALLSLLSLGALALVLRPRKREGRPPSGVPPLA